jgi:hypothetical protein
MRKMILIGTLVLLSTAAARAGETRSLSLATAEQSSTRPVDNGQRAADATQPTAAAGTPVPAPIPAQSAAVSATGAPAATAPQPSSSSAARPSHRARASKPRSRRWTEARIVSELHRHGIYW